MKKTNQAGALLKTYGIFIILILIIAVLSFMDSSFMTTSNVKNILR